MKKAISVLSLSAVTLVLVLVTLFGMPTMASSSATLDSKYRVFCANNKIEIEQRTVEQQKNARGSNVCMLGEFDYLSDAEKHAESHGGKGADCKCP
ncbi:MAG TPA: hypothetical protein VJV03_16800 [Pyrinomonadaceae bacterium]|nr:hypothetical protein [Pyrinomonadaceae bacterium]